MLLYLLPGIFTLLVGTAYQVEPKETKPDNQITMEQFDLNRYLGEWYEIARFDNRFERGLTHVRALYRMRDDGMVEVINSGLDPRTGQRREAHGKARTTAVPGELKVSFFWIFYAPYNILELDADYQWVLVGSRSPKYLWILSRTPTLPEPTLAHILRLAQSRGYDIEKLIFVDQS